MVEFLFKGLVPELSRGALRALDRSFILHIDFWTLK